MHWRFPLHNRIRKVAISGTGNSTRVAAQDGAGWNPKLRPGVKRGSLSDCIRQRISQHCRRAPAALAVSLPVVTGSKLSPGRPAVLKSLPTPQRTCGKQQARRAAG